VDDIVDRGDHAAGEGVDRRRLDERAAERTIEAIGLVGKPSATA
jgi:hypothetical protein